MNYKTRQPFPHAAYVEGQRNFTYFDRSLTSGLTDEIISSPGDFLYIDQASTGVVSVELNMRQGGTLAPILLAAGGSIECDFSSVKLTASAQLNKTVRIIVGNGARIKGGANVNADSSSIQFVDGGLLRTVSNQAFLGCISLSANASAYPHSQLWNPENSGKNVFVESVRFSSEVAQLIGLGTSSAAISSNAGTVPITSKYFGQAIGATQIRYQAALTDLRTKVAGYYLVGASVLADVQLREPILLAPGQGLLAYGTVANSGITASFEWFEQ